MWCFVLCGGASSPPQKGLRDANTQSILFLTDESDQPARIGFSITVAAMSSSPAGTVGGVHYYLTSLKLAPHETRAIDIAKLRDAQVADFKKNKIPASATDGSVSWIRLDAVPVTGRVVVITRQKGVASGYDCCTCPCAASYKQLTISPTSCSLIPNLTALLTVNAMYQECNGPKSYYDVTGEATMTSLNTGYVQVQGDGWIVGVSGGQCSVVAKYSDYVYSGVTCTLSLAQHQGSCSVNVQVPTSVSIVSGTDSTTSEASCTTGGLAGCGVTRTFKYQVNDQNGQPIRIVNMALGDVICNTTTNQLNLQVYTTSCGGNTGSCWGTSGPCGKYTDANGQFTETLSVCAPACKSSGTCITAGQTIANQTWTVAGHTLSSDVKGLSYQCNKILVNGQ